VLAELALPPLRAPPLPLCRSRKAAKTVGYPSGKDLVSSDGSGSDDGVVAASATKV
jgi:hypothetical protein